MIIKWTASNLSKTKSVVFRKVRICTVDVHVTMSATTNVLKLYATTKSDCVKGKCTCNFCLNRQLFEAKVSQNQNVKL